MIFVSIALLKQFGNVGVGDALCASARKHDFLHHDCDKLRRNADVKFFRLYAAFRFRNVQRLADCGFQILNVEPLPARKTAVIARTETLHVENAFRGFVADHYGYFFRADVQHGDVIEFCHYSLISLIYIYYNVRTRVRQAFNKTFYNIFRVYVHIYAHYVPIYAYKRDSREYNPFFCMKKHGTLPCFAFFVFSTQVLR